MPDAPTNSAKPSTTVSLADQVSALVSESKDVLLERLATRITDEVLTFGRVEAVEVELTKLRPPIAVDADQHPRADPPHLISPDREHSPTTTHRAFIALGSNLGDSRESYLRPRRRRTCPPIVAQSQVYETDPVGGPDDQGAYLNMVVELETTLDPFALLRRCQRIEGEAMRQRVVHWGPRTLDVDIVLYDDVRIESPDLVVPHPRFAERRFVLTPLAEIAPDLCPAGWEDALDPAGVHARSGNSIRLMNGVRTFDLDDFSHRPVLAEAKADAPCRSASRVVTKRHDRPARGVIRPARGPRRGRRADRPRRP